MEDRVGRRPGINNLTVETGVPRFFSFDNGLLGPEDRRMRILDKDTW